MLCQPSFGCTLGLEQTRKKNAWSRVWRPYCTVLKYNNRFNHVEFKHYCDDEVIDDVKVRLRKTYFTGLIVRIILKITVINKLCCQHTEDTFKYQIIIIAISSLLSSEWSSYQDILATTQSMKVLLFVALSVIFATLPQHISLDSNDNLYWLISV